MATFHSPKLSGNVDDLAGDDPVIGMAQIAIGAGADQRRVGEGEDACGPVRA